MPKTPPPRLSLGLLLGLLLVSADSALNVDLWGVNYDLRNGPDWMPDTERCKPAEQVKRELQTLAAVTSRVRTYSLADCSVEPVLAAVRSLGMSVWLGVWTASDPSVFDRELSALQALVAPSSSTRSYFFASPTGTEDVGDAIVVDGLNVGSEAVYRGDVTSAVAVECLARVRQVLRSAASMSTGNATAVSSTTSSTAEPKLPPLAITDVVDVLLQYPELVAASDVVTVNVFPFWERVAADKAAVRIDERLRPLFKLSDALGKSELIITETGWASAGSDARASKASPADMAQFVGTFLSLASRRQWRYYYFAGFDTPYKAAQLQDPTSVEASFGLFDANGTMKPAIARLEVDLATQDEEEETSSTGSSESVSASSNSVGDSGKEEEERKGPGSSQSSGDDDKAGHAETQPPAATSDSPAPALSTLTALVAVAMAMAQ